MSQTAIRQKKAQAKATASVCLGTGTSLLVQAQGGGKSDRIRVGKQVGMKLRRWAKVRSYKVLEATFEEEEFCCKMNGES